ncbi:hypothetical protein [Sorangium sp. So ce385]|uniref:hypothetical protein n=1 Tax=Sorangium sp. So ce385 TaxID=3133308 RepID=UPI003F5BB91A
MGRLQRIQLELNVSNQLTQDEKKTSSLQKSLVSRLLEHLGEGAQLAEIVAPEKCNTIDRYTYVDKHGAAVSQVVAIVNVSAGNKPIQLRTTGTLRVRKNPNGDGHEITFSDQRFVMRSDSPTDVDEAVDIIGNIIEKDLKSAGVRR